VDAPALRRVESHFKGADGLRLFRRAWLPERPARVLALVHGYAEHSGRYDAFARWFAARGAAVHAYDHRGHGRSAGTRTHVDRFGSFLDDLERFLELVRAEHPEGPLTLVGHSMGGLVTAAFLVERAPAPSSAVLSGPALALGPGVSRLRVAAARALRRVAPRLALGSGLDPHGLSRDPAVVRGYLEDPHVHRTMTASLAAEILEAIPRTAGAASRVAVPLLVLHGEEDPMCPVEGSRAFFAGVKCAGSRLTTYPGLRHEIFNEPEQEQVFADLWRWLEELSA
jgi:alpha-beta hydrolase superfamily lysophospholipase